MREAGIPGGVDRLELAGGILLSSEPESLAHDDLKARIAKALIQHSPKAQVIVGGTLRLSETDAFTPDFFLYHEGVQLEAVTGVNVGLVIGGTSRFVR